MSTSDPSPSSTAPCELFETGFDALTELRAEMQRHDRVSE